MNKPIYLNECSFRDPVDSEQEARRLFGCLYDLLRHLDGRAGGLSVVAHQRLTDLAIGPHPAAIWFAGDRERVRRIKLISSRAPFDVDIDSIREELQGELEFRHEGDEVIGLGLASWHDSLAVSVNRDPWRTPELALQRFLVAEGPQAELIEQEDNVTCRHATIEQHVEHHAAWIDAEQIDLPRTPDELWQYADRWYSNIAFHPRVRAQLVDLGAASPAFSQVVEKLAALQDSLSGWNGDGMPDWGVHVTGEHSGRERLCWFEDLDGEQRLFEQHARFTPGEGRIHFRNGWPRPADRRGVHRTQTRHLSSFGPSCVALASSRGHSPR